MNEIQVFVMDDVSQIVCKSLKSYLIVKTWEDIKKLHNACEDQYLFIKGDYLGNNVFYALSKKCLLTEIDLLDILDEKSK